MQRYENVVKKIVCIITTFKKINLDHNYSTIYNFLVVKQFVMKINCLCKIKKKKKEQKHKKKTKKFTWYGNIPKTTNDKKKKALLKK